MKQLLIFATLSIFIAVGCNKKSGADAKVTDAKPIKEIKSNKPLTNVKKPKPTANNPVSDSKIFSIKSDSAGVTWTGSNLLMTNVGTFNIKSGNLVVRAGKLVAGIFNIDVNSIKVTSIDNAEMSGKLTGHLKSPDFFDTAKYPMSIFQITSVKPYVADPAAEKDESNLLKYNKTISGNLKIKNITKNVTFPAEVNIQDKLITAKANFNVDRQLWGLSYKPSDESMMDQLINDNINIKIDISAISK